MSKYSPGTNLDTDSLQADVMRFMAIIAFCLIAILALVKNIEPVLQETSVVADSKEIKTRSTIPAEQVPLSEIVASVVKEPVKEPVKASVKAPVKVPLISPQVSYELVEPALEMFDLVAAQRDVKTAPNDLSILHAAEFELQPGVAKTAVEPAPGSLSPGLRFASDRVFLSLIGKNQIQVYASTRNGILGLTPQFKTQVVKPSGQLYELLPESVPDRIRKVFGAGQKEAVFLVALPGETMQNIQHLLKTPEVAGKGGTLVIDSRGRVSYEVHG